MGTVIKLQSCLALPGSESGMMTLPDGVETIADLLMHLGGQMDFEFVDPTSGDLVDSIDIIVNEKEIWFYPSALKTPLKDGDVVEIYLIPLGGG
jgi:hypothetical protein